MLTKSSVAPSPHAESARVLIEKIRALRTEIPNFTTDLIDGRALTGGMVPERFLESTSVAIQNNVRLAQAAGTDATTLRDAYAYALAYDPVVQELIALAQFVAHSVRVQRNAAGICALDVYNTSKRLSSRKDFVELKPFVDDMREKLKKGARSRKPGLPSVTPAPDPVPAVPAAPAAKR